MADTIGLMGVPSLCTLGRPYICGGEEYLGVRKSHSFSSRCPSLQRRFRVFAILFSVITVLALL